MKKFSWILALIAALAMVFVGCGGGGDGEKEGPKEFTLVLGNNFQYGHGYQGYINALDYINGKITKGDEFIVSFKVKANRALEDTLNFGLVDGSGSSWDKDNPYWGALSWDNSKDDPDIAGPDEKPFIAKDTEVVVAEFTWTALQSSSGTGEKTNMFFFETSGACTKADCATNCDWTEAAEFEEGTGGKEGPVTLSFTDFTFKRKGDAVIETCPVCKKPLDECTCPVAFDFRAIMDALEVGKTSNGYDGTFGPFFNGVGGAAYEVVTGKNLQITTTATWGEGIDIKAPALKFKAGDKIKVTGKVGDAAILQTFIFVGMDGNNPDNGVITPTQIVNTTNIAADASFVNEVTLTAGDIANLEKAALDSNKATSVIRIGLKEAGTIIISNIEITRAP